MADNEMIRPVTKAPVRTLFEAEKEIIRLQNELEKYQPTEDPEKRIYVLLLFVGNNSEQDFEIKEGRTEAYEYLKGMIEEIDIEESKVLVDGVKYQDAASVHEFMTHMKNFFNDSFDIEDYSS